jgi:lipid A disaccharide synthetase
MSGSTGSGIDEAGQRLVDAANHLREAVQDLRMLLTLLRQQKREVPPAVEEAIALVADALTVLDT